jgi:Annexin
VTRLHEGATAPPATSTAATTDVASHVLLSLQQHAGNRAVTGLVQRLPDDDALTPTMATQLARRLHDATAGWGTDEDAIYGVFSGRTQSQVDDIEAAYRTLFGEDLRAVLADELDDDELAHLASLAPSEPEPAAETSARSGPDEPASGDGAEPTDEAGPSSGATPDAGGDTFDDAEQLAAEARRTGRAEVAVQQLHAAMSGWGTDEEAIFAVLTGRSTGERQAIADLYGATYGRSLEHDLRDEMSGAELDEALRLLGQGELSVADELHQAMAGAGTDEDRIVRVLTGLGRTEVEALLAEYRSKHGSLLVDLADELSGDDLADARRRLGAAGDEAACREVIDGADPDLLHQVGDFTFLSVDDRLLLVARVHTETVVGPSDEGVLERIWSAADMAEAAAENQALYGESRNRGAETPETLTTFGSFENEFTQDMFEGDPTVGHGLFTWTLVGSRLHVRVPINFQPDAGVTPPYATWNSQIDGVWNQFAFTEPGGQRIELQFEMVNESGASRTVQVAENKVPGTMSIEDRANAGKFYVLMRASTVPHEFGHFIGLPDEYQRSHDDFLEITGRDKVGPPNASGRSEADIADDLHTALHADPQTQRRIDVRTLLANVGLIVGGIPQQGEYAQAVRTEYDTRHGELKDDLIDQLNGDADGGDRWDFQTVFSYASGTIMGNPGVVGVEAHEHPVESRHLREFLAIVQRRHPGTAWTAGPR